MASSSVSSPLRVLKSLPLGFVFFRALLAFDITLDFANEPAILDLAGQTSPPYFAAHFLLPVRPNRGIGFGRLRSLKEFDT